MGRSLPAANLRDANYLSLTQRMINLCVKVQKEKNISLDEAYQEAFQVIKSEGTSWSATEMQSPAISSMFKAALYSKTQSELPLKIQVKDILQEK